MDIKKHVKKIRTLTATFTLAAAGFLGLGSTPAQGQTVSVNPATNAPAQTTVVSTTNAGQGYVSQEAVNTIAETLGVEAKYYRAGKGYTAASIPETGENVGLEFNISGSTATVARVFNLNDPDSAAQYTQAREKTAAEDARLAVPQRSVVYSAPVVQPYIQIAPPRQPLISIGFILHSRPHVPDYYRRATHCDTYRVHRPAVVFAPRVVVQAPVVVHRPVVVWPRTPVVVVTPRAPVVVVSPRHDWQRHAPRHTPRHDVTWPLPRNPYDKIFQQDHHDRGHGPSYRHDNDRSHRHDSNQGRRSGGGHNNQRGNNNNSGHRR